MTKRLELKRISDEEIRACRNMHNDAFYTAREFNGDKESAQAQLQDDQQVLDNVKQAIFGRLDQMKEAGYFDQPTIWEIDKLKQKLGIK